ncbi:MAG: DsrE/DsrF/DrsH-like family protein [Caldivirga sp.]|jgi:peroxiredoxin family protein|nr:DsrE/DsrF/DrsH-like family protein [Caldivirga sp.]
MANKTVGIVVQSGAANRICCVVVYAAAALASGRKVVLHLVNEGLVAFRKDVAGKVWGSLNPDDWSIFPEQYRAYVEGFLKNLNGAIKSGSFKHWHEMLAELKKEYGDNLKIYACPLAAQMYNIKKEDLLDIVDAIAGAETFLAEVEGGTVFVF